MENVQLSQGIGCGHEGRDCSWEDAEDSLSLVMIALQKRMALGLPSRAREISTCENWELIHTLDLSKDRGQGQDSLLALWSHLTPMELCLLKVSPPAKALRS